MSIDLEQEDEIPYYVDGCAIASDYVYIASKYESVTQEEEYDLTRMLFYQEGEWSAHDLEWDVRSVCDWQPNGQFEAACALSVNGDVSLMTEEGLLIEKIPEAGAEEGLGSMRQIRAIGADLYACGFHGQVYRRKGKRWVHADAGLLERDIENSELYLSGIDGTSESDIYVVGLDGRIHHWNGQVWRELKSPTKSHLDRVLCVTPSEVYACGYNSALLRGNARDGFRLLDAEEDENFWGIANLQGKIYFSALSGLFTLEGDTVLRLETDLTPPIGGHRLGAADGVLWSFGADDLTVFDGKKWERIDAPEGL